MSNPTLTVPVPPPAQPSRHPAHPVNPLFVERWSRRAYTGETIPDDVLFALFEAARWAPSGGNAQPWRFLYSKKGSSSWPAFFDLLAPGNQRWAASAAALVVLISKKITTNRDNALVPSRSHSFDTGAAWQNLALQAHLLGWSTRAIGGYNRDKAREVLRVPEDFALEAAVAIGRPGDKALLPTELQANETPNGRHPLDTLVFEGGFPNLPR